MNIVKRLKSWSLDEFINRHGLLILLISLFLLNTFLILSRLTLGIYHINPNDGAKYIESGRLLLAWGLRDLSWGPLVAFVYAPLHLIIGNNPNWFLLEAWGGNVILFGLFWLGLVTLSRNMKEFVALPVTIGLLFTLTVWFPILENQSDALFIFFSMMAVVFIIKFRAKGELKSAVFASLMVGFGVLCRVETILLVISLAIFLLAFNHKRQKVWKIGLAVLLPLLSVIALYAFFSWLTIGEVNLGLGSKSLDSLAMNHAFFPGSKLEQAYKAGEPILGTVEEHHNSILWVVFNRPLVLGERALVNLLNFPEYFIDFFGQIQGVLVAVFSVIGIGVLIRKKDWGLLALLLIWPLHSLVALIFLTRHIVAQMSFIFVILAAIGITDLVFRKWPRKTTLLALFTSLGWLLVTMVFQFKPAFTVSLIVFGTLLIKLLVESERFPQLTSPYVTFAFIVALMMAIAPTFVFPARILGNTAVEQGIIYLQASLSPESNVLASLPISPIAAKMNAVIPPGTLSPQGVVELIDERNVGAVFWDSQRSFASDNVYAALQEFPERFNLAYLSDDGSVMIYLVVPPSD